MEALYLALGGLAGSALKAYIATDQNTLSRQTIADVAIGAAVGFLYPLYPVIEFPPVASVAQKAVMMGVLSYFSADMIQGVLFKLGVKK